MLSVCTQEREKLKSRHNIKSLFIHKAELFFCVSHHYKLSTMWAFLMVDSHTVVKCFNKTLVSSRSTFAEWQHFIITIQCYSHVVLHPAITQPCAEWVKAAGCKCATYCTVWWYTGSVVCSDLGTLRGASRPECSFNSAELIRWKWSWLVEAVSAIFPCVNFQPLMWCLLKDWFVFL